MTKVLKYFDLNGLAEAIRYILIYTDQEFEDFQYKKSEWPIKEVKDALPFGRLPILEENGRVLHQSAAIAKYVSANSDLIPSDPWQQAQLEAVVHTIYEFDLKYFEIVEQTSIEAQEKARKTFYEETLPYFFSRFEGQLKKNNGYFGGKLSWADFVFTGIVECANLFLKDAIQKDYPTIAQLMKKIQSLPRVKEYVKNRKPFETSAWFKIEQKS